MTVGECCNRQVVIARAGDHVTDIAGRMRDFHVGTLIVVDEREERRLPVGIVTDRDLVVRVLADGARDLSRLVATDVMTRAPLIAREGENVWDTVKKMRSFGVRRVPVVNERGGLEGILSFDDLLGLLAEELSDMSALVSREQQRERDAAPASGPLDVRQQRFK